MFPTAVPELASSTAVYKGQIFTADGAAATVTSAVVVKYGGAAAGTGTEQRKLRWF